MTRRMLRIEEERQAKAEHTEQVKIENTELRLRVNDLETQLHDIQLKYEETKSRERQRAKEQIDKIEREKNLELEVARNNFKQSEEDVSKYKKQLEQMSDKVEEHQNRICDQIEKYQALNEK